MTKQNKNRKEQATLEQMVKSGSQIVLMREDGTEQPIEALAEKAEVLKLGSTMRVIEMDKTFLDSQILIPIRWLMIQTQMASTIRAGGIKTGDPGCSLRR